MGDGDGDGDADGDGDVLAHLVKPQGKQMKPSYKFRWHRGDQYAYCWAAARLQPGMATAMGMEAEMEREWAVETYGRVWSSRKVST